MKHNPTWEDLYVEYYQRLSAHARRLTHGNREQVEDLVHDTIVHALVSRLRPSELKTPLAYLFRIMRNVFIDQVRKAKHMKTDSLDDPLNVELEKQLPVIKSTVQCDLENKEMLNAIKVKNARLSAREKRLFALLAAGYSSEEISLILHEDVRITRTDCNALKAKLRYRLTHSKKVKDS